MVEKEMMRGAVFDKDGNLKFDGADRYYYDHENRLTDVNNSADEPVASYKYDWMGRRVKKLVYGEPHVVTPAYGTASSTISTYTYDGDQVIAEYDGEGNLLRKFVYGPGIDEPVCMIDVADNNAVYYYQFDGLGSVAGLSDATGNLVERYTYDVFGKPTIEDADGAWLGQSKVGNPYAFTGRRYDHESGTYYYRAREYDPAIGRFMQADTIGCAENLNLNLYSYVGNNNVNKVDPMGLFVAYPSPPPPAPPPAPGTICCKKMGHLYEVLGQTRHECIWDIIGASYDYPGGPEMAVCVGGVCCVGAYCVPATAPLPIIGGGIAYIIAAATCDKGMCVEYGVADKCGECQ